MSAHHYVCLLLHIKKLREQSSNDEMEDYRRGSMLKMTFLMSLLPYCPLNLASLQELSSIIQDLKRVEQQLLGMDLIRLEFPICTLGSFTSVFLWCANSHRHDGGPRWYFGRPVKPGPDQSTEWPRAQPGNSAGPPCAAPWSWSSSIWSAPSFQA